jgi:hypothetical protein
MTTARSNSKTSAINNFGSNSLVSLKKAGLGKIVKKKTASKSCKNRTASKVRAVRTPAQCFFTVIGAN